jgi:glycosyltransferase involved in cell wall biosynthesis
MAVAARRLAENRYSWTDVARRLRAIYELVLARTRGRSLAA